MMPLVASWLGRRSCRKATALICAAASVVCGCGGGSGYSPTPSAPALGTPAPVVPTVAGQYNFVLTSRNASESTHIYAAINQTGKTFSGTAATLLCPMNDPSRCEGKDVSSVSISLNGTVDGMSLTVTIASSGATTNDTITMIGTPDKTSFAGTYTDSLGDAGTWVAAPAVHPSSVFSGVSDYAGTFNSTSSPLTIAPGISMEIQQNAAGGLEGKATTTNWLCGGSLMLTGRAIGDAINLADATKQARILILPADPLSLTNDNFNFTYQFEATATSCGGDVGRGTLQLLNPWDY